jgi:hypothetical protein
MDTRSYLSLTVGGGHRRFFHAREREAKEEHGSAKKHEREKSESAISRFFLHLLHNNIIPVPEPKAVRSHVLAVLAVLFWLPFLTLLF